jgi:hypothetical protein
MFVQLKRGGRRERRRTDDTLARGHPFRTDIGTVGMIVPWFIGANVGRGDRAAKVARVGAGWSCCVEPVGHFTILSHKSVSLRSARPEMDRKAWIPWVTFRYYNTDTTPYWWMTREEYVPGSAVALLRIRGWALSE